MKFIMVLDKTDEQRMHSGEMIPVPGQIETFITMEPKRGSRLDNDVKVALTDESAPKLKRGKYNADLSEFPCPDCGKMFKGKVGVSTHSRHCPAREHLVAQPSPSTATLKPGKMPCPYCEKAFPSMNSRNAHMGGCTANPKKRR